MSGLKSYVLFATVTRILLQLLIRRLHGAEISQSFHYGKEFDFGGTMPNFGGVRRISEDLGRISFAGGFDDNTQRRKCYYY